VIRRLFLAGVATAAFACGAAAADLPAAPGPSYYPAVVTPVPYYNWTGIYFGANAAVAWASQENTATTDVPTAALISTTSSNSTGFGGGGQVGANWFFSPSFVLGLEGDFDALTNSTTILSSDGSNQHVGKLKYLSTVRGRFGLTADRFMVYVTGGVAWGEGQVTRSQLSGTANNAVPGTVESITTNRIGWTAGAGVEYAIFQDWTARLEYRFTQLDSVNYTFPLAQRATSTGNQDISELLLGVNYKFNWGAPIAVRD
jgi:outer membrane immunogenic protein